MASPKVRIGRVSGTLESLQLEITVWNDDQSFLDYAPALALAVQNRPAAIFGMPPSDDKPQIKENGRYTYTFLMVYESTALQGARLPPATPTDGKIRQAAMVAKSVTRTDFIEPVGVFAAGRADVTADYPGLKFKIDAPGQDSHYHRSAGRTFDPLAETHVIKHFPRNELVTDTWLQTIEDVCARGCFNSLEYDGYPAGTLQIVRFHAQPRNTKDWEFIFGFGNRPTRPDVDVGGGVIIPLLLGNYHYWTRDALVYNAAKKTLQPQAKLAIVGTVWEQDDFNKFEVSVS